jgi:GH18 family chitinase
MDPFDLTEDRIHYAFVNLNSDWTVDNTSLGQDFQNFLAISNAKVASFGGWDFSTDPSTYDIFRQGVQPANQQVFAQNLVQFLTANNLNGIDIDWEYPGALDIPGIPADDPNNGQNFLTFLQLLKPMMPSGATLSITIPASYWYLQHFPIYEMQSTVDYFILMSYDYYGQWD